MAPGCSNSSNKKPVNNFYEKALSNTENFYLHQVAPSCGIKKCVQKFLSIRVDPWLTSPVKVSRKGKSSLVNLNSRSHVTLTPSALTRLSQLEGLGDEKP